MDIDLSRNALPKLAVIRCMFNPNYLSRSERRAGARIDARLSMQVSQPVQAPDRAVQSRQSVSDMMMFTMERSNPYVAADPSLARPALAAPAAHHGNRQPMPLNYLGCLRPPTFFPRAHDLAPKPQKRIVGFDIAGSEASPSDSSNSDSEGSLSDSGE